MKLRNTVAFARAAASIPRLWCGLLGYAVAAIVVLTIGCSRDPEVRKRNYFESGNRYLDQSKPQEAAIEYRNALQIDPRFAEARVKLAEIYEKLGDGPNALNEYVRAADLLPNDVKVQLLAGQYLLAARRLDDALARADAALAQEATNVEAHVLRGNALGGLNELEKALAEIEEAVRLEPARGPTYTQLGIVEFARGRNEQAEAAFKKAIELAPNHVQGHLALANYYWATRQLPQAEQSFTTALKIDPENAAANRAMAAYSLSTGRTADAEQYLKRLAEAARSPGTVFALAEYYLATNRIQDAIAQLEPLASDERQVTGAKQHLARAYAAAGNRAKAHTLVDEMLARDGRDTDALLLKGQLSLDEGKRDEALAHVKAAVDAAPASIAAQFALGKLYAARGDGAGAREHFTKVLDLNPRATAARLELSKLQLASGNPNESLSTVDQAARIQPDNIEVRLTLVRSLLAAKQFTRADTEIRGLLAAHPDIAAVHVQSGVLAAERKNQKSARAAFERALALAPDSVEALAALVALDVSARDFTAAKTRVDAHTASPEARPELLLLAARTYVSTGDLAGAERLLRRTIDRDPTLLPAYGMLARIYLSQKKIDLARQEFEALAERQSMPVAALTMAGIILQSQGNQAEAKKRFERALAFDPRAAVAANNLAWIYAEAGENLDGALQLAQTAARAAPDVPEMMDTLGWVYYKKNLPDQAIQQLSRSVEKTPGNPVYRYHLGLAYVQAGDPVRGRQSLAKALELGSDFAGADVARRTLAELDAVGR